MAMVSLGTVINDGVLYVLGSDGAAGLGMILWRYRTSDGAAFGTSPWLHSTLPVWTAPSTMDFNTQIAIGKDKIGIIGVDAANDLILTIITKSSGAVSSSTTIVNGANKGCADICADASDNFYVAWANTANTPNRISKYNSAGVNQWTITTHTRVYSVYYDRINSRLIMAGQGVSGGANSVAIVSATDGSVSSSGDPSSAGSWLSIRGDGRGSYRIGRSNTVASINSSFTVAWTKTVTGFSGYKLEVGDGQQTTNAARATYRVTRLAAILDGDVTCFDQKGVIPVSSGSAALSAIAPVIFASQNGRYVYFADGYNTKRYDPVTNAVETWSASAGSIPIDSGHYARLICTWRGRTVLAGILTDPQNWFMSKVNDPRDWDYGAAVSATMPVAGNQTNSTTGMPADIITSLIPYTDNLLFLGCDHTLSRFDGDPMSGGQIQIVSDTVGVAWGRPFCRDPFGRIYFVSSRGPIYRMTPGGQPERISMQIDRRLDNIDMGTHICRMAWDDRFQGAYVFLTPLNRNKETVHFWWDARNEGWWPDVFKNLDHNPKVAYLFDGDDPEDRKVMLGSWDGYVRNFEPLCKEDDGYAIESRVLLGPLQTKGRLPFILKDLQVVLASEADALRYAVQVGESEEVAKFAAAARAGTFLANRNRSQMIRRQGHAAYIKLYNDTKGYAWAMESMLGVAAIQGQKRRRIF